MKYKSVVVTKRGGPEVVKIKPIIAAKFPILEAPRAYDLLESGQVIGNIVLVAPEMPSLPEDKQPGANQPTGSINVGRRNK